MAFHPQAPTGLDIEDTMQKILKSKRRLRGNVIKCPHSKRTKIHYFYWQTGVVIVLTSLACIATLISNDKTNYILKYYYIFNIIKASFVGIFVTTFFYPTRYCYIQDYFLTKKNWLDRDFFRNMVDMCTVGVSFINTYQSLAFVYFLRETISKYIDQFNWIYKMVFVMESIDILYKYFLLWYRVTTPTKTFWLALYGDIKTPKPPKDELYPYKERWIPDKWSKPGCEGYLNKTLIIVYYIIVYPIYVVSLVCAITLFIVAVILAYIIAMLYLIIDLYIVSILCCCICYKRRSHKILNIKRYSYLSDYVTFEIILKTFRSDKVFAYFVQTPPYKDILNPIIIIFHHSRYIARIIKSSAIPRYSLWWDYTTFHVFEDSGRTTYTRWLPGISKEKIDKLPEINKVASLFLRKNNDKYIPESNMKLSLLFAFYVKFFTKQFSNTNINDGEIPDQDPRRPNKLKYWDTVNEPVGFNLSQVYGSEIENTNQLRTFRDGLLKTTVIQGYEWPQIHVQQKDVIIGQFKLHKGTHYFNVPNAYKVINDIDFHAIYVIFFRHHQFVARSLKKQYPDFDDEKLFQITKLINTICFIKCTLGLFGDVGVIQSTVPSEFQVKNLENIYNSWKYRIFGPIDKLFPSNAYNIPIEFNIFYKWHQLIPPKIDMFIYEDDIKRNSESHSQDKFKKRVSRNVRELPVLDIFNPSIDTTVEMDSVKWNKLFIVNNPKTTDLTDTLTLPFPNAVKYLKQINSLETFLQSVSKKRVGGLELKNVDSFLVNHYVKSALIKCRHWRIASFNDYRERMGFYRYKNIDEITDDPKLRKSLKDIYGENGVDNIEFYVGIFAEQTLGHSLFGAFLHNIWTSSAITFVTSSPLLRMNWNEVCTPLGKQIIDECNSFGDLVARHTKLYREDCSFRTIPWPDNV